MKDQVVVGGQERVIGQTVGYRNDIDGLTWIYRFGWLRSKELGQLLWPNNGSSQKYAEAIVRKWLKHQLVLTRKLPLRAGSGIVLSHRGAEFLRLHGVPATSGKDWGETKHGIWKAPLAWQHDLFSMGVLAAFHELGYAIIPERELRRKHECKKIPDGLVISPDGKQVLWVEVENVRKDGACKQHLVETLLKVAAGNAQILDGHRATGTLLCFVENARDEKGHVLDHVLRVSNAIKRTAKQAFQLDLGKITLAGAGFGSVELEKVTIESDKTMNYLRRMEKIGWDLDDDGNKSCPVDGLEAIYRPTAQGWAWRIEQYPETNKRGYDDFDSVPIVLVKGVSESEMAAKRQLAIHCFEQYEFSLDFPDL